MIRTSTVALIKGPLLLIHLFIALTLLSNCSKKEETLYRTSELEMPLIRGFRLRDVAGNYLGNIGFPNIKTELNNIRLEVYPNPCENQIAVFAPALNTLKRVWIVKAKTDNTTTNALNDLNLQTFVAGGSPVLQKTFYEEQTILEVSALPKGAYRIYLQIGDDVLYDNILVNIPIQSLF